MAERTSGMAQEPGRAQGANRDIREQAREQGAQVQEQAQEAMQQVGTGTSQISDLGRTAMNQLEETLEDRIRNKPLQAVLIAAGAGMFFGLLWRK